MTFETVKTHPIEGQKPGTSGLRKKTRIFMGEHFLENFIQAIFNAIGGAEGKTFVLGGDGRFFNAKAIQTILKMAAANGAAEVIVGRNGLLSTPAASHLIRVNKTDGGIILSASHNPGGVDEDFGVKFNISNGGPAPENVTAAMLEATKAIDSYRIVRLPDVDLGRLGAAAMGQMRITVVDPVADYRDLMETLFDFDAIRAMFAGGFSMRFDAMHAVTGPYAQAILEQTLGAPEGTVVNAVPKEDFGGGHPDPNPIWAKPLMDLMMSKDAPDFGAASDGDGDRNMIVGRGQYVTPSDSLAVLLANAHLAPGYATRRCRCRAVDADKCRLRPRGRKAGHRMLRDADGLEVLRQPDGCRPGDDLRRGKRRHRFQPRPRKGRALGGSLWLNILAVRKQTVAEILADHWNEYGRNYYSRHDYEAVPIEAANGLMDARDRAVGGPAGQVLRRSGRDACRRIFVSRPDRWIAQRTSGASHLVRGRWPCRLAALGNRHRGRDASGLSGTISRVR